MQEFCARLRACGCDLDNETEVRYFVEKLSPKSYHRSFVHSVRWQASEWSVEELICRISGLGMPAKHNHDIGEDKLLILNW